MRLKFASAFLRVRWGDAEYSNIGVTQVSSVPVVFNLYKTSGCWWLTTDHRITSRANSTKCGGQLARLPVRSPKCEIHYNVQVAPDRELTTFQMSLEQKSFHITVKHSQWALLYVCSAMFCQRDQCRVGLSVPSGYFCRRAHSTFLSHASLSTV